jgi:hypothetical protein
MALQSICDEYDLTYSDCKFLHDNSFRFVLQPRQQRSIHTHTCYTRLCSLHKTPSPYSAATLVSHSVSPTPPEFFFFSPNIEQEGFSKHCRKSDPFHKLVHPSTHPPTHLALTPVDGLSFLKSMVRAPQALHPEPAITWQKEEVFCRCMI